MTFRIQTAVLLLLWLIAFIPVYHSLFSTWLNHSNNSHGILVPLISAFLLWQKRDQLAKTSVTYCAWGLAILIASTLLYIISYAGAVAVVARAMIVSTLIGLILYNFGKAIFLVIQFPLLYLFFMVPVPDSIYSLVAFPLQLFATRVAAFLIQFFAIPVYREGNMLYFVQTQLEVAEACSGLRSLVAFIMLSILFAHMMNKVIWKQATIILSALPLAIIANIFRVTSTGILAHFYGDKVAQGFLHSFSGLSVFAFGFVILLIELFLIEKIGEKSSGSDIQI